LIEVEASGLVHASRESIWRHLSRPQEWYRWYPGLHGTTAADSITKVGQTWRSTGQMGRMLYRGEQRVCEHQLLERLEIAGQRRPWFRDMTMLISLKPSGPNVNVSFTLVGEPGLWPIGGTLLRRTLRRRLQQEAEVAIDRLTQFVENTMPYH
jgi:hypothetical protein